MRRNCDYSRKVIKNVDCKIKVFLWKVVKFEVAVCKSEIHLVLIL